MTRDVSLGTKFKDVLQECMEVAGAEDESQVLSAFKMYREHQDEIRDLLILREKVTKDEERTNQTKKALQVAVATSNHVLGAVMVAVVVRTLERIGGSSMGQENDDERKIEKRKTIRVGLCTLPIFTYCPF